MIHTLKILPEYFEEVANGNKTFEIRRNDRNYKVGDVLILKEYVPLSGLYTGKYRRMRITYITDFAQQQDFVVMSIVNA